MRQGIENAAAAVVQYDDDGIQSVAAGEGTDVVLAGEVADEGDDRSVNPGDAERGRQIAVNAAGAAIAKEAQGFVTAAGSRIKLADGQ